MRRTPTPADRETGSNVRNLRHHHGETLLETITRSGLGISPQTLSRIELGEKHLTIPIAEALAAHFGTVADRIICKEWPAGDPLAEILDSQQNGPAYTEAELRDIEERCAPPEPIAEQEWLGNKPTLTAVPDHIADETAYVRSRTIEINLDAPLSLADYREQVWIPYLEHRYATDLRQTG